MLFRALVLNADYSFLHVSPNWFKSVQLLNKGCVSPLASYEKVVRSDTQEFQLPAVVIRKTYINVGRRRQGFQLASHKNIWVREGGKCAYCGKPMSLRTTTREHVVPRSKGGGDGLLNVVACCGGCNGKKADMTLVDSGMVLRPGVQLRPLTNDEKLTVLLKTHEAVERKVWLDFLKKSDLTLF